MNKFLVSVFVVLSCISCAEALPPHNPAHNLANEHLCHWDGDCRPNEYCGFKWQGDPLVCRPASWDTRR